MVDHFPDTGNMITVIVTIILLICSFVSKAVKDTLVHHFGISIFRNLNPRLWDASLSGSNKWKNGDKSQGERFFLSSTLLVWWTDWWHRFDILQSTFLQIALTMWITIALSFSWYYGIGVFAAIKIVCDCTFHFPYTYFFIKKK